METGSGKMYQINKSIKKRNSNNQFVVDCITTALFNLLEKKNFEEITITEIVKKAGVSRMGFYRNFTSKENVLERYIFNIYTETVEEIKNKRELNFAVQNIMVTTLEVFKNHTSDIKLLLNRNLNYLLFNCYEKALLYLYKDTPCSRMREYANRMFIGELYELEISWIENGMKESPSELARIYYKILRLHFNQQFKM